MAVNTSFPARQQVDRVQRISLIVGVVGLILAILGSFFAGGLDRFFESYLLAYLFWVGLALGSFALVMIQHLAGGTWGAIVRRPLEAAMATLPVMALLFIPIIIGIPSLYVWSGSEEMIIEAMGEELSVFVLDKLFYLNVPFFILRTVLYFAIWIGLAFLLYRWSEEQDRTANPALVSRFRGLSGVGLVTFVMTMTFAAVDWGMSLEPEFWSSIYGAILMVGQGLSTFAFLIIFFRFFGKQEPLADIVTPKRVHDIGKFTLGFVILWTYVNMSQFIIVWSANLPEETPWYLNRGQPGWDILAVVLVLFHFVVPFFILLSRQLKRSIVPLSIVAGGILIMRFVDLFWLIIPAFHQDGIYFNVVYLFAPIGIGGIWIASFLWMLKRKPLLPLNDPRLEAAH